MSARPRIVVLDDYERALRRLADWSRVDALANVTVHHEKLRGDPLMEAIRDADAIVTVRDRTPFRAELVAKLPKLRYFVFTGGRNTQLDPQAFAARGIPVSHTEQDANKESTTELAWALILAAVRRLESQMALVRNGQWRDGEELALVLSGQRLGLIGLGNIGSRVAAVGKAFGMEVVAWSPNLTPERARAGGAILVPLEEILETARVVSLHLVPSDLTRKLLNAERLARMRPDSILVNTSRAALIDMPALAAALKAGRPGWAALDVYEEEPLPADFALRSLPNVTLTPHLGFVAQPVFASFARGVVECLGAWLEGKPLVRVQPPA